MALADWDARLLSPARALELAGDWPVFVAVSFARLSQFEGEGGGIGQADQWQVNLRCCVCGQSATMLGSERAAGLKDASLIRGTDTSIGDLLSAVMRHMVTAHNLSLSGATHE